MEKKRLAEADVELNQLEQAYKSLSDEMETMAAAKKKLDYEVSKLKEESAGLDKYLHDVTSKHLWIEHEKHLFNVKGSDYDFGKMSVDALRKKLQETKDYIKRHSGHVNTQVMEMMDSMEKKESHLKAHLGTIKNDKVKIEETIDKLNAYKREALEKTWTIVNKQVPALTRWTSGNTRLTHECICTCHVGILEIFLASCFLAAMPSSHRLRV